MISSKDLKIWLVGATKYQIKFAGMNKDIPTKLHIALDKLIWMDIVNDDREYQIWYTHYLDDDTPLGIAKLKGVFIPQPHEVTTTEYGTTYYYALEIESYEVVKKINGDTDEKR